MDASISNYLAEAVLNEVFRGISYAVPTNLYIAYYTSDPTGADVGTEVSGGSYARKEVAFTTPAQTGGKATTKNTLDITFPQATALWGLITHMGIRDALTSGNLLYYGELITPRYMTSPETIKISADEIVLTLT